MCELNNCKVGRKFGQISPHDKTKLIIGFKKIICNFAELSTTAMRDSLHVNV